MQPKCQAQQSGPSESRPPELHSTSIHTFLVNYGFLVPAVKFTFKLIKYVFSETD